MQHSIYLHIPFCSHRCAYCDFNTFAGQERLIPAYVSALCAELDCVGHAAPQGVSIHTIFFGGGTPSLLSEAQVRRVINKIGSRFHLEDRVEITLEANPGSISAAGLKSLQKAGINRISLGVQSANGEELRMLERTHDYGDVLEAVAGVRRAGIGNFSLDLLYGLPQQSMEVWQTTVRRVLKLDPAHISAYALTLEHGTPFGQWVKRGLLPVPDPDLAADMYEWLEDALDAEGYHHYEISNWARDGRECLHNLQYWRGDPYLGFGAGAHGYAGGCRYSNVLAISEYVARMPQAAPGQGSAGLARHAISPGATEGPDYPCSPAVVSRHQQTAEDDMAEFMIMGLRLTQDGISPTRFERRFGASLTDRYAPQLKQLIELGLLEWAGSLDARGRSECEPPVEAPKAAIRLTPRGRLLGNRVFAEFVAPTIAQ